LLSRRRFLLDSPDLMAMTGKHPRLDATAIQAVAANGWRFARERPK
jgi:hypothetical protein